MASAGRILIMPKGDYDANSTYEKLDLVKYKGTSWLAKKNATGVEPSEGEYWQKIFDLGTANNLTTTAEGFALDARQGKILDEKIADLYKNSSNQTNVLADCNNPTALNCFCDSTTLNTPYKQGLTNSSEGRVFCVRVSSDWNQEMFLVNGGSELFIRYADGESWKPWEALNADKINGKDGYLKQIETGLDDSGWHIIFTASDGSQYSVSASKIE